MAREKTMSELRDILNRIKLGHGIKQIRRDTGVHREVIRKLKRLGEECLWLHESAPLPTDKEIHDAYYGAPQDRDRPLSRFDHLFEQYMKAGLTYESIHRLIRERMACSESTVRRYVKERFGKAVKAVVRRELEPGVMEVDFGTLGKVYDPETGRVRVAKIFSARLRYSRKAYREIVFDEKTETFSSCHIHAFERFGGVPKRVTPDNLKAAVIHASFTDPLINASYHELALHYGFLIDPCKPYKPEHKGGVENDIKYVKRSMWAPFRQRERERGHEVPHSDALKRALAEWEETICDVRTIKGVGFSPNELFLEESKSLGPLPAWRFDPVRWLVATPGVTQRISVDKSRYTVPERYIGKKLMVCVNSTHLRAYFEHELIAIHPRSRQPHKDIVNNEHLGERYRAFLARTEACCAHKAAAIGPRTAAVVESLLADRAVRRLNEAWAILGLAKRHGEERLERACERSLSFDSVHYGSIKRILEKRIDEEPIDTPSGAYRQAMFAFMRQSGYFDTNPNEQRRSYE
jgi:transposase